MEQDIKFILKIVLKWLLLLEKDENMLESIYGDSFYGDSLVNNSSEKKETLKNISRFGWCWFCIVLLFQNYLFIQIV